MQKVQSHSYAEKVQKLNVSSRPIAHCSIVFEKPTLPTLPSPTLGQKENAYAAKKV